LDYKVGQVLYALSTKQMSVIPIQITERIVRETLEGEAVTHVAVSATGKEISDIRKVKAIFYENPDDVKDALISNVTEVIDEIVKGAKSKASSVFNVKIQNESESPAEESDDASDDKNVVTLSDGTVAKVSMPKSLGG
tara:strand:- start:7814 stop:8227 length:414 start_codon:yes stop_codon:yes gene_type:complete